MTPDELAEIRKRVEAASPDPWVFGGSLFIMTDASDVIATMDYGPGTRPLGDGLFIVHARQDIPRLLDYIRELESRLELLP